MLDTPMTLAMYQTWFLVYTTVLIEQCMDLTSAESPKFEVVDISGQKYLLSSTEADTEDAETSCSKAGSQLALFDTNAEFQNVSTFLASYVSSRDLGVEELLVNIQVKDEDSDGIYEHWWKLEELSKKVWASGEPDSGCRKVQRSCCVRIYFKKDYGVLKDTDCEKRYLYLCKNVSACSAGTHNCSQVCVDITNGYMCQCMAGWILEVDGYSCVDIDECNNKEPSCDQVCTNTAGSYVCSCDEDNTLNVDAKSCTSRNGFKNSTDGGDSNPGQKTTPSMDGCNIGYTMSNDTGLCEDIDECMLTFSDCQHACVNTEGSYACSCYENYTLGEDHKTCVDVDECARGVPPCAQQCVNTEGGYSCGCWEGFQDDESGRCTDINECELSLHKCSHHCQNTNGSYVCSCRDGFILADDKHGCEISDTLGYKRCPCHCRGVLVRNMTTSNTIGYLHSTVRRLSLNFHDLSSYRRTKICVTDPRVTSQTLGYMGVTVFVGIFCFLTASDVVKFFIYLKTMITNQSV